MTIDDLISAARASVASKLAERKTHEDAKNAVRDLCLSEKRDPSDEEAAKVTTALEQIRSIDTASEQLVARVTELETEKSRDEAAAGLAARFTPGAQPPAGGARVVAEKRTYSRDNAREGISFLSDVAGIVQGDLDAMQRIQRHKAEERVERGNHLQRDVGTGAFAGLTVPQYLTDLVAPTVAAGRPLANVARHLDLPPDGMTVNISRITTATAVAFQSAEVGGVQETDIDDTLLTINVRTLAGSQDISIQAIQRSVGAEEIVVQDLALAYATKLDNSIINDDGTSGTHLGIRSTVGIKAVTYTDSTPTVSEAWGPLFDLQQQVESGVFGPLTHYVMHPRRWAFFASGIGTNFAFVNQIQTGPWQGGTENTKDYGTGVKGYLAGLPVLVDANIPTNISSTQDVILGITAPQLFLWEQPGSPLFIRAEQPLAQNLGVRLVIYGFSAFTAGRYPGASGTISGSGLTTPTYGIAAS